MGMPRGIELLNMSGWIGVLKMSGVLRICTCHGDVRVIEVVQISWGLRISRCQREGGSES